jgi:hypothetical protein
MAKRSTALIGAAGEHYVAFRLSALGFPVALTRGGSPTVDLMVGDLAGQAALSFQVKTSSGAWRSFKRSNEKDRWEFDVGVKAGKLSGPSIYYAFVDLKWGQGAPDVFVVPSEHVARVFAESNWSRNMFWIMANQRELYFEAWEPVLAALGRP